MESGSAVVGRDERKKKYHIYVEEYVLSYLRRESDSLELSEIYFYGSRQENGRKLYVYGRGEISRLKRLQDTSRFQNWCAALHRQVLYFS